MGFYRRYIFPHLCHWMMQNTILAECREQALAGVEGDVLEIGFGTGLNLPHYPAHIKAITTVDPNPGMSPRARRIVARSAIRVDQHVLGGEALPFEGERFDTVVSTWTLCSIGQAGQAVAELYRVLRPGGRFVFVEHGLSESPRTQRWQRRLNPVQRLLADGCRLDLDVASLVSSQPFQNIQLERFEVAQFPKTHRTMYRGQAVK